MYAQHINSRMTANVAYLYSSQYLTQHSCGQIQIISFKTFFVFVSFYMQKKSDAQKEANDKRLNKTRDNAKQDIWGENILWF